MADLSDDDQLDELCALLEPEADESMDEAIEESIEESMRVDSEATASFAATFAFDSPEPKVSPGLAAASHALKSLVASQDTKTGVKAVKSHRSTSEVTREYRRGQDFNAATAAASKTSAFSAASEGPRVHHKLDARSDCECHSGLRLRDISVSKACETEPGIADSCGTRCVHAFTGGDE
jgi:hypothetical protein